MKNDGFLGYSKICGVFHWMGVLGCVQPMLMIFCNLATISLAHTKSPASSASVAKDITNLIICTIVSTGILMLGMGKFSYNMMCAPYRLEALITLR